MRHCHATHAQCLRQSYTHWRKCLKVPSTNAWDSETKKYYRQDRPYRLTMEPMPEITLGEVTYRSWRISPCHIEWRRHRCVTCAWELLEKFRAALKQAAEPEAWAATRNVSPAWFNEVVSMLNETWVSWRQNMRWNVCRNREQNAK